MTKFKKGDRVKILLYPVYTCGHEGETAVVTKSGSTVLAIKLDKPCTIHRKSECRADRWREECLELVEPEAAKGMTTWQDRFDELLKEYLEQDLVTFIGEVYAERLEAVAEAYKAGFIKGSLEARQAEADVDSTK